MRSSVRGRSQPGGEGAALRPRPAPPGRPPGDRDGRTRPERWSTPTRTSSSPPKSRPPEPGASLTLHDNGDGTTTGHFTIPSTAAAIFRKILDSMTAPRRMRRARRDRSSTGKHRRGLAFAELLEHLPTEHLHTRTAATVVVTIDHTVLTGAMKTAQPGHRRADLRRRSATARLQRRASSPPSSTAARWPSTSGTTPGCSPKPNGWPRAQHPTCAADGCNAPTPGASSTTDNPGPKAAAPTSTTPIPLCPRHHHRIHDPSYTTPPLPDGSLRFHRRP